MMRYLSNTGRPGTVLQLSALHTLAFVSCWDEGATNDKRPPT